MGLFKFLYWDNPEIIENIPPAKLTALNRGTNIAKDMKKKPIKKKPKY